MRFSVYQESHIGGRKYNQDRMGYSFTRDALLLLLADGMGGHIQGEVAATLALQTIAALFQQHAKPYIKKPEQFLQESFFAAHREIHRYRAVNKLEDTPRTTLTVCLIQHGTAVWAHAGDSRLYWMRDGKVLARTRDHSRIEVLIAQGKVSALERDRHPDRNKLFNCVGAPNTPIVEISRPAPLQTGDVLLLCSDGLWGSLPDALMAKQLHEQPLQQVVPGLIRSATLKAGAQSDNVTALAMIWEGTGASALEPSTILTSILPPDSITTTIQAPHHADLEGLEVLDDYDIEEAIEEIRGAIEKSSRLISKS